MLDRPLTTAQLARRPEPSLQIVGSTNGREIDLPSLAERGIRLAGRVTGAGGRELTFADDLATTAAAADSKLDRLLGRIDHFAATTGLENEIDPPDRPRQIAGGPDARQPLEKVDAIRAVIWATGYRRAYPWLRVPVLNAAGEIQQSAGRTPAPGLLVIGMRSQTRRSSTFLDGVRHDAALVVDHLINGALAGSARRAS